MAKRTTSPLMTFAAVAGVVGLAYLAMKNGPMKRPSVDGLPVHVNGNGPMMDESWRTMKYC